MLRFLNKNRVLSLFAFIGAFIPTANAELHRGMSSYEEVEEAIREINGDWEVTHTQREHTVETTTIMSHQTTENVPVLESVPQTNSTTVMVWDVHENNVTNQTVEMKGLNTKEYFDMILGRVSVSDEAKPAVTNAPVAMAGVDTNAVDVAVAPVTNTVEQVKTVVTNTPVAVVTAERNETEQGTIVAEQPVQTETEIPQKESPDWKKGLVGLFGMVTSFLAGYVIGKKVKSAEREQPNNRSQRMPEFVGPLPRNEQQAPQTPAKDEKSVILLPAPTVQTEQKPVQKKPVRIRTKLADLPPMPELSMEEMRKMGLKSAAELRKELLTIDPVSKNEIEKSFGEGNPLPKVMKDKVMENILQDREAQALRLKAVRDLARIKAERKILSGLMAKAKDKGDETMMDEINDRRVALTVVRRDVFEQLTGKYMGDIKEQRRLLAKDMTIARRRDDQDKMIEIMKQRQFLKQQEKELRAFVAHINYERDHKTLMKKSTVDLIKNHHLADKREKRRLQDANRRVMKAMMAEAEKQNKQLTR